MSAPRAPRSRTSAPRTIRERSATAVEAARALLEARRVEAPDEIDVESLAASCGVSVLWGELAHEEGHLVHRGDRGVARVGRATRASAKWRFVVAHELGHFLLHRDVDQFARCTTGAKPEGGTPWRIEAEANDFATELLLPLAMVRARCVRGDEPSVSFARVKAIARDFGTSLSSTALRVTELTDGACAVAYVAGDRVQWKQESRAFQGRIVKRRALPSWEALEVEGLVEESVAMGETGRLVWVHHDG